MLIMINYLKFFEGAETFLKKVSAFLSFSAHTEKCLEGGVPYEAG